MKQLNLYANETNYFIFSQRRGSGNIWPIANSEHNKVKSAISLLFNYPEVLFSASNKAKLFAKNFCNNSNLDDSGISGPFFPSRINLKLHNIYVIHKMVKKVITNYHSSKASGADCIPVVVLMDCGGSNGIDCLDFHTYHLNSSICVRKNLVFQIVRRFHWCSLYLRMLGKSL